MSEFIEDISTCFRTLITPAKLFKLLPLPPKIGKQVISARLAASQIMQGQDKRLLVIVGPCSIHDYAAALEYAHLLKKAAAFYADELLIVMRVYFEKPRTNLGWKGLIRDPYLNGSFDINHGLSLARKLLLDLGNLALPAATEFLDTITPQYLSDLISWSAIGARTSESQTHREFASGLAMPVGFKNTTDGNVQIAIDAVQAARHPHHYLSIAATGVTAIVVTPGNPNCHIVLRGAKHATNYSVTHIRDAVNALKKANLPAHLMVDCNHGNSSKNYLQQNYVVDSLAEQMASGANAICGVMIESNLVAGKQQLEGKNLVYGQSITDGCISWDDTLIALEKLAYARLGNKLRSG